MTSKKKKFSSFNQKQAFQQLGISDLHLWQLQTQPRQPSDFFEQRRARLQHFDLKVSERAKELLIDAICEEALEGHDKLKIWKAAPLQSDFVAGEVDYLVAKKQGYIENPMLCVIEPKKDDFLQGLAQCLVAMQACQWNNQQSDQTIDIFGIVTNGDIWKFYKLITSGEVYETLPYSIIDMAGILGVLDNIFQQCEQHLNLAQL